MEMLIFVIFAALAVGSALVVVVHKNPVYSTMSLVLTLFSVAMLFVMLGAPFIGVLQILVYTGAILVLFLFVIMLLNVGREESQAAGQGLQIAGALGGAALFALLVALALWRSGLPAVKALTPEFVSLKGFSGQLFTEYLLPFEIVGLLLLVAVIGATVVARRPPQADSTAGYVQSGFEPRTDPRRDTPHPEESEP
jgi:NADH-quinone oxidoreductase subunit J